MNYSKLISLGGAVAITATGLFLMAPPASAKRPIVVTATAPVDIVSRHISYADLNLASAPGELTLKGRVGAAVKDLCAETVGAPNDTISFRYSMVHCSRSAWNQANPQISQAVQRATEIASTGTSLIAATAITIALPQ